MNRPSTAREALIVEAIGEVALLLDRIEALAPAMETTRKALSQSTTKLDAQLVAYERRMSEITETAKFNAVNHIAARTNELARNSQAEQTRAMQEAAQAIFRTEVNPTLQGLVMPLRHLAEKLNHPWERWLTHAATATVASAFTFVLVLNFVSEGCVPEQRPAVTGDQPKPSPSKRPRP